MNQEFRQIVEEYQLQRRTRQEKRNIFHKRLETLREGFKHNHLHARSIPDQPRPEEIPEKTEIRHHQQRREPVVTCYEKNPYERAV